MANQQQSRLQDLGSGAYAWVAPVGTWGWSNAGLVVDGDESLLVDTLFDLKLTQTMLDTMHDVEPCSKNIGTLVNTHANGDHTHGNELVTGADIVASVASALEMEAASPQMLADMMATAGETGHLGEYLRHCFAQFNFEGIRHTAPNKTFEGQMDVQVGDKPVHLIEVGPAHTRGDVLVHSPKDSAVFTGDILFIEGTPVMWEGPVDNWIKACDLIESMQAEYIVPGHGPITDRHGVRKVKQYLEYVRDQARSRYDAGMSAWEAAQDISLAEYSAWSDPERIAVNVETLYREFSQTESQADITELFSRMAELAGFKPHN